MSNFGTHPILGELATLHKRILTGVVFIVLWSGCSLIVLPTVINV